MAALSFQGQARIEYTGTITLRIQPDVPLSMAPPTPERLLEQIANGTLPVHATKRALTKKALQVQIANIQRGLRLNRGSWSDTAQQKLEAWLQKPTRQAPAVPVLMPALLPPPRLLALADAPNDAMAPAAAGSPGDSSESSSSSTSSDSDSSDEEPVSQVEEGVDEDLQDAAVEDRGMVSDGGEDAMQMARCDILKRKIALCAEKIRNETKRRDVGANSL